MKTNINRKGFTIVELVIVIAVIAILAAVLIPTFSSVVDKANASAALSDARSLANQLLSELLNKEGGNTRDLVIVQEKSNRIYVHAYCIQSGKLIAYHGNPITDAVGDTFDDRVNNVLDKLVDENALNKETTNLDWTDHATMKEIAESLGCNVESVSVRADFKVNLNKFEKQAVFEEVGDVHDLVEKLNDLLGENKYPTMHETFTALVNKGYSIADVIEAINGAEKNESDGKQILWDQTNGKFVVYKDGKIIGENKGGLNGEVKDKYLLWDTTEQLNFSQPGNNLFKIDSQFSIYWAGSSAPNDWKWNVDVGIHVGFDMGSWVTDSSQRFCLTVFRPTTSETNAPLIVCTNAESAASGYTNSSQVKICCSFPVEHYGKITQVMFNAKDCEYYERGESKQIRVYANNEKYDNGTFFTNKEKNEYIFFGEKGVNGETAKSYVTFRKLPNP